MEAVNTLNAAFTVGQKPIGAAMAVGQRRLDAVIAVGQRRYKVLHDVDVKKNPDIVFFGIFDQGFQAEVENS